MRHPSRNRPRPSRKTSQAEPPTARQGLRRIRTLRSRRRTRDLEPRIPEDRTRARPGESVRQPLPRLQVHRIAFRDLRALPAKHLERMREQGARDALVPPARLDEEAGQRPDRIRVLAGERPRPVQPRKIPPRPEGDPADRLLPHERDRAFRLARRDQRLHPPLRRQTLQVVPALTLFEPPVHTPAAPTGPTRTEQLHERRPQGRGEIPYHQFLFHCTQPKELPDVSAAGGHSPIPESSDRMRARNAPVAQLDRVLGYEPRGREFESLRARQLQQRVSSTNSELVWALCQICAIGIFCHDPQRAESVRVRRQMLR